MISNWKKGLATGLATTMLMGIVLPDFTYAESSKKPEETLQDLKNRLGLEKNAAKIASVTKDEKQAFTNDQLIIRYTSPISAAQHKKAGGTLKKRISSLHYDVITVSNPDNLMKVAENYANLPGVRGVTRSALVHKMDTSDFKASRMYHLSTLSIEKAQRLAGKNRVKVGVIDTGVEVNHPELKNKVVVNKNAMNPLKKGQPDIHGTHVSGIIAAEKGNGIGGFGVAPNSDIVSIDVFNRSMFVTDYTIAEGVLEAIRQKVKVINMSLGTYFPSPIIKDAVKQATDAGIIVVASAGNDGADMVNYPAAFENVISVGATNDKNELAEFSTYGKSVDVVAPGEQIYSPVFDYDKTSSFAKLSGTSMSAPMVTGVVSLLLSKYPKLSPYQVNYILTQTTKDLGEKGYDTTYGYGMIDPVKVLSFNPKNIPADPNMTVNEGKNKATLLKVGDKEVQKGSFKKPDEAYYYKVNMKKDEYLQLDLNGQELYDYKMELSFFESGEDKPVKTTDINDSTKKNEEGSLYQAKADGTLLIKVMDSFGHYNVKGESAFNLTVERFNDLPEDTNTMDNPVSLGVLPAETGLENYFTDELSVMEEYPDDMMDEENQDTSNPAEDTAEEDDSDEEPLFKGVPGDSDFYKFSVPAAPDAPSKVIKVNVSDVSGIDSSLSLYMVEKYEDEEMVEMIDSVGGNGTSEGEEASFEVIPGQEYIMEVTNKPFFDEFFFMMGTGFEINYDRSYSSHNPYKVSIELKDLPIDEDQFPRIDYVPEEGMEDFIDKFQEYSKEAKLKMMDPYGMMMEEDSFYDMIKEIALPYEEGVTQKGYSQYLGDEDWFSFTPKSDGLFHLFTPNHEGYAAPMFDLFVYNKQVKDLDIVYSNGADSFFAPPKLKEDSYVGLKKGITYFIRLSDPMYRANYKPYEFTLSSMIKGTSDRFENNDDFKSAKKITTKPIEGNFSSSGDIDTFYFKPDKEGVFGVTITPGDIDSKYSKLPGEVKKSIDPVLVVLEDKNGNGKLEAEEEGNLTFIDYGFADDEERGAFRAKKGKGYFILAQNYFRFDSSLVPYQLSVTEASKKDEDAGSVLKNKLPSKPLALRNSNGVSYEAGYMNMTGSKGDTDYYRFKQVKDGKRMFRLTLPSDLDGVITVYDAKGKQVGKADHYGRGDLEYLQLHLKKGTYYIKVEEVNGDASVSPYKIHVY
ncbi:S8 family peptidase [Rossellomorea sp. YZS02]|uniref:S8 family peptidase n=1 Tax=Rossellomorea sp. YZS02 TaxID=3097358 RepID=UPI002A0B7066|nr:S8 family peptidase [Rossellomorea sp. YZS02]MDX8343168.1 S8 family peptidase [Rossellomorea sp. YZS02]